MKTPAFLPPACSLRLPGLLRRSGGQGRKNDPQPDGKSEFRLLVTTKTSTMQKELNEAGETGYRLLGLTVGETLLGGRELVCILGREPESTAETE